MNTRERIVIYGALAALGALNLTALFGQGGATALADGADDSPSHFLVPTNLPVDPPDIPMEGRRAIDRVLADDFLTHLPDIDNDELIRNILGHPSAPLQIDPDLLDALRHRDIQGGPGRRTHRAIGVQPVADAVVRYLPSPVDVAYEADDLQGRA